MKAIKPRWTPSLEQIYIHCEKCDKRVDEVMALRDDFSNDITLKVFCHGEVDNMVIDRMLISYENVYREMMKGGVAFRTSRLEEGQKQIELKPEQES